MIDPGRHEHFCATCLKGEKVLRKKDLQICSRCDIVRYCSKECQRKDWPEHKQACGGKDKRSGIPGLIKALVDNTLVKLTLQECAILAFDLMNNPDITLTRFARVDVQMEPRDINDLESILLGTGPTPEKIQGVLQITGFQPNDPIPVEAEELERTKEIWHFARALAADRGHPHEHVVVLAVSYACGPVAIQVPMVIYPQLKKRPPTGTVEEKLENLNLQIRVDPNNEMGALRSEMQPADIRIMRELATFTERGPPWMMLAKIATEKVYADIYQRLGQDD
ncbi:hypothetical protein K438DRAFT_1980637 [Mycena galopus ATCC 62051]|nr:hypothetical protein K438DRAFT_1980637 [Mycena galopus ATCC 62051]